MIALLAALALAQVSATDAGTPGRAVASVTLTATLIEAEPVPEHQRDDFCWVNGCHASRVNREIERAAALQEPIHVTP